MSRILEAAAGLGLAVGIGITGLRWLTKQSRLHIAVQRLVANIPEQSRTGAPRAIAEFLGHKDLDLKKAWRAHDAPKDALTDQVSRHLDEVRDLLSRIGLFGRVGFGIAGWMISGGYGRPIEVVRWSGGWSSLLSIAGIVASVVGFSGVFQRYHDTAYDTQDWRLPDDHLLSRLYPERFYQIAAVAWLGGWLIAGIGLQRLATGLQFALDSSRRAYISVRR